MEKKAEAEERQRLSKAQTDLNHTYRLIQDAKDGYSPEFGEFAVVRSVVYPNTYYVYKSDDATKLYGRVEISSDTFVVFARTKLIGGASTLERALEFLEEYDDAEQEKKNKEDDSIEPIDLETGKPIQE